VNLSALTVSACDAYEKKTKPEPPPTSIVVGDSGLTLSAVTFYRRQKVNLLDCCENPETP